MRLEFSRRGAHSREIFTQQQRLSAFYELKGVKQTKPIKYESTRTPIAIVCHVLDFRFGCSQCFFLSFFCLFFFIFLAFHLICTQLMSATFSYRFIYFDVVVVVVVFSPSENSRKNNRIFGVKAVKCSTVILHRKNARKITKIARNKIRKFYFVVLDFRFVNEPNIFDRFFCCCC